jgi:hypothetical protein
MIAELTEAVEQEANCPVVQRLTTILELIRCPRGLSCHRTSGARERMALFPERMPTHARKAFDTADILRDVHCKKAASTVLNRQSDSPLVSGYLAAALQPN